MRSHLVHILPVWQACEILGESVVRRMVSCLLHLRQNSAANRVSNNNNNTKNDSTTTSSATEPPDLEHDIDTLTRALFYRHPPLHDKTAPLPSDVAHAWKRWLSARQLALDKATLIHFVVPHTVQPHSGPSGHMGLFDCWVYALQGHAMTSATTYYGGANNTLVWLPDVLILLAAAKQYQDFVVSQKPMVLTEESVSDNDNENNVEDTQVAVVEQQQEETRAEPNPQDEADDQPPRIIKSRWSESSRKSAISEAARAREEIDDIHRDMVENQTSAPSAAIDGGGDAADTSSSAFSQASARRNTNLAGQAAVNTMALLAFRIYDSYQKKGSVTRDTVHRFLTDVHGEESFKDEPARALLDDLFYVVANDNNHSNNNDSAPVAATAGADLQSTISETQFVTRVVETFDYERRQHLLLDWLALLLVAMIPPPEIAPSVAAYLETMDHRPKPLCDVYQIAESRLFEVKRRFHSLVRAGPSVIQGDPMGGDATSEASGNGGGSGGGGVNSSMTSSNSQAAALQQQQQPKHSVSQTAFLEAVCQANAELGHGGYLPPSLATLVFAAGARNTNGEPNPVVLSRRRSSHYTVAANSSNANNNALSGSINSSTNGTSTTATPEDAEEESQIYWSLANLIQFGCMAVRQNSTQHEIDEDMPMLRFLFNVFALTTDGVDAATAEPESLLFDDAAPRVLTRRQVEQMLLLMIEHMEFRLKADGPQDLLVDDPNDNSHDSPNGRKGRKHRKRKGGSVTPPIDPSETVVDLEASYLLGILPAHMDRQASSSSKSKQQPMVVPLKDLVEYAMDATDDGTSMSFEDFCAWNVSSPDGGPASRLAPITHDLRLIASVLFGVPPTLASMEIALIAEIERRHKARYPQTSVSRRGPRGTIWHIIDADWLRTWADRVKDVAGTDEDGNDGRTQLKGGIRGLGRIDNASLLTNTTLALRQDIQWKHDYEILPPLAWNALQAWYDGGPPIHRSVVRYVDTTTKGAVHSSTAANPHSAKSRMPTENEIELYPYFVTVYLCDSTSGGEARPFQQNFQLSRVSPVGVMLVQLCKELDVDPQLARLWVLGSTPEGNNSGGGGMGSSMGAGLVGLADDDNNALMGGGGGNGQLQNRDWILSLEQNIVDQRKARFQQQQQQDGGGGNQHQQQQQQAKKDINLLLELKNRETGRWPRGEDGREWLQRERNNEANKQSQPNLGDGIVGLYNMGNTCFLNSSIQCISHTPIFREYFTSKAYLNDINTTNPLGHQGQLAQVSAVLINSLWRPFNQNVVPTTQKKRVTAPGSYVMVNAQSLTPKTFKDSLGKFNELFAGNEQHDAQELLTFLLAGLSEDLNRIVDKPYIEAPDSDGRPDQELADIWWANHLKRELSIVVALFTGQYKNLLTCRTCKYESARFEPFSTLTVPLPEDDSLTVSIIVYPFSEGKEPTRYCVRVRASGNLGDVLVALAKELLRDSEEGFVEELPSSGNDKREQAPPPPTSNGKSNNKAQGDAVANEDNEEEDEEEDEETETETEADDDRIDIDPRVVQKARDLSIVDMRDGFIFRIAPLSWALQDLQNKDTGDLPTMHAYELDDRPVGGGLDAVADETETTNKNKNNDSAEPSTEDEPKSGYLAISQRRSDVVSRDYLHPLSHRLFGTPLLLRLSDMENCTGRQLYDLVSQRLRPLVPKGVLRFLVSGSSRRCTIIATSPSTDSAADGDDAANNKDSGDNRSSSGMTPTMTDSEEISAGPVPRYGFRLRVTSRDGRKCLICPWYKCCVGCLISDDNSLANVMDGDSLVVDWHFAVDVATSGFGSRTNHLDLIAARPTVGGMRPPRPQGTVSVRTHSSCGIGGKGSHAGAITLEQCLDAFAKEERIPEAYCSRCKDFRVQTTRMTLWRLPPVLVIHLKRFQFTSTMRRKLRDLVVFPLEGLDLSRIMAPNGARSEGIGKVPDSPNKADSARTKRNIPTSPGRRSADGGGNNNSARSTPRTIFNDDDGTDATANSDDASFRSLNNSNKTMLYDLYGVIHHQGALSGGHYVASLKSEIDGQWRLFNDAQIYEIHARDVIDASAYILFYMRRDVAKSRLADFWDLKQVASMSEEEMDNLVKGKADRCVIS